MELLQSYIETIDAHTMGEASKNSSRGIPKIQGKSMMEKSIL